MFFFNNFITAVILTFQSQDFVEFSENWIFCSIKKSSKLSLQDKFRKKFWFTTMKELRRNSRNITFWSSFDLLLRLSVEIIPDICDKIEQCFLPEHLTIEFRAISSAGAFPAIRDLFLSRGEVKIPVFLYFRRIKKSYSEKQIRV